MASFEETDVNSSLEDVPPPIPPQRFQYSPTPPQHTYQHVNYRMKMSKGESKYMMQRLEKMNMDLFNVHGIASIVDRLLEVRPYDLAKEIDDWEYRVGKIIKQHKTDFRSVSIPLKKSTESAVIEYLYGIQQKCEDFSSFDIGDGEYEINGGSQKVNEALEHINNMTVKEIEISCEYKKPPHLIDYFIKFGKKEVNSIHPPVTIIRSQDNPGIVVIRGVKESIQKIEAIANEKLLSLSTDYVPLTQSAHRLLVSTRGKQKLKNCLGSTLDIILYTFEKTASREEYTHQACITSSDAASVAVAKRIFDNLCREEKILLQQDQIELLSTDRWNRLIEQFGNELFVSVRTSRDIITVTGEETDTKKVALEIRRFLSAQDDTTEEFQVSSPVWDVICTQLKDKLERVYKEASQNKVHVVLPTQDEDAARVVIVMTGNIRYIENVKVRLSHMIDEVLLRDVPLPPKVGLHRLVEKGILKTKCLELSRTNKVVIRFEIDTDNDLVTNQENEQNSHRIMNATSAATGVRIALFTGNYAQQKCDAIVTFIPENPKFSESVFTVLGNAGGREVQNDLQATLGSQKLISASVYRTQYTGNMKCHGLFHIVLPKIESHGNSTFQQDALKKTLQNVLQQAKNYKYNTLVFSPLTGPPLCYPADLYAQILSSTVCDIKSGSHTSDLSIQVFVDNECESEEFELALKDNNFHIHDHNRLEYVPISKPNVTRQLGNPDSLQKAVKITTGDMLDLQVGA